MNATDSFFSFVGWVISAIFTVTICIWFGNSLRTIADSLKRIAEKAAPDED